MSFLRIDGFDHVQHEQLSRKYRNFGGNGQLGAPFEPGRFSTSEYFQPDDAHRVMNTAFGRSTWAHDLGIGTAATAMTAGFHLKVGRGIGGAFAGHSDFFVLAYEHNITPFNIYKQFAFTVTADGRIEGYRGGNSAGNNFSGFLVFTSAPLVTTEYSWFEFQVTLPTGVKIYKDGVLVLDEPDVDTYNSSSPLIGYSLVGFAWERFGFDFYAADNYYVRNDLTLQGECRVTTNYPAAEGADLEVSGLIAAGSATASGISPFGGRIMERRSYPFGGEYPDGDASYLRALADGYGRFKFARWFPVGVIKTLAVNIACMHTGTPGTVRPILRSGGVDHFGAWRALPTGDYAVLQWLFDTDPSTSDVWDEESFVDGLFSFGFEVLAGTGGEARISQLAVERLHEAGSGSASEYRIF